MIARMMMTAGKPISYQLVPNVLNVNEGSSVTFTVTTVGVPDGTALYWTQTGIATGADFVGGVMSGSFVINNGTGSFVRQIEADLIVEGSESFTTQIRSGSVSGPVLKTSSAVTIADTSTPNPNEVFYLDFENPSDLTDAKGSTPVVLPAGGGVGNIVSAGSVHDGSYGGNFGTHYLKYLSPGVLGIGTGDFTFQCWLYPPSSQPAMVNGYIPLFGGTNYSNTVCFWMSNHVARWYVPGGVCDTTTKLTRDAWNHLRVVRHGGKIYIFINGVLGSAAAGVSCPVTNLTTAWASGFFIAAEPSQLRYFRGSMDSFQVFNASLGISNFTPVPRN